MSDFSKEREFGLDLIRAIAILLVLISHGRQLLSQPDSGLPLTFGGWYGVELFFVLSGFLIGTVFIREYDRGLTTARVTRFWTRRWLRTIPAYWGCLLFIWFVYGRIDWSYFVFMQPFLEDGYEILPVSWSLVIEEMFYLILPLAFLSARNREYHPALVASLVLITISTAIYAANPFLLSAEGLRKFPFRFDNISVGVLLAYLYAKRDLEAFVQRYKAGVFICSVTALIFVIAYYEIRILEFTQYQFKLIDKLYSIITGVSAALLIALSRTLFAPRNFAIQAGVRWVSILSYSCYLWHLMVISEIQQSTDYRGPLLYILTVPVMIAISVIPYLLVEKPFLAFRDRLSSPTSPLISYRIKKRA
ncbi:acyltransferase family protein [Aurantimonas coralicida]|uniref:acyltransferase family protein n=1 Tax=Aurantimonas coralicida TaxID=182270 RepID=UPI0023A1166E|nr:acyltransferase [Aurantimonas coralicida]MDE0922365.1 acyltransferase [Aurantimonas coralicida]